MTYQEFEQFSKSCGFLSNLQEKVLKAFHSLSQEVYLQKGDYLLHEGDLAEELYIVVEGELEVLKYNAVHEVNHVIGQVVAGDPVGELALLDPAPRSATVRALSAARLLRISFSDITQLSKENPEISLFLELTKNLSKRLRSTNTAVIEALKMELEEHKLHEHMGRFLVLVLVAISVFMYGLSGLKYLVSIASNSSYVSIPIILFFTVFTWLFIRSSKLPMSTFGITTKYWKKSICEAVLLTIPVAGVGTLIKLFLIHNYSSYMGQQLFEPYAYLDMQEKTIGYWLFFAFAYSLFVPLQELIARGTLQGLLEQFLIGKHKVVTSIFISNLLFGIIHFFMSERVGMIVFVLGLYMGFLYAKTRNLIGPIIAHILIGIWVFFVLGFVIS